MAHEDNRCAGELGDVERLAHDGDVEVGPNHQPERGAADEVRLAEPGEYIVELEIRPHQLSGFRELLRCRHHQSVADAATPGWSPAFSSA
jgi:hypothetical protein